MNRYPLWVYVTIAVGSCWERCIRCRIFSARRPRCRCPGRATLKVDTRSSAGRGSAQERRHRSDRNLPRPPQREGAARRHRYAAEGEGPHQLRAQPRRRQPFLHGRAPTASEFSPLARSAPRAADVPGASTLRGGVHFLLQVDMRAALTKRRGASPDDVRSQLRDKSVRHSE